MKRACIKVTGKVQGVFFRASTRQQAIQLGINGIVRNQEDGSVYIEAEGNENQLHEFIDWCSEGPVYALVNDIKVDYAVPVFYDNFRIIH